MNLLIIFIQFDNFMSNPSESILLSLSKSFSFSFIFNISLYEDLIAL